MLLLLQRKTFYNNKGPIHQEDIIINLYAPNKRAPKIHKAKMDRLAGRKRQVSNNS